MADKQLFKIGEVARMYHLSLGILRHYEKEGLLAPEYTDPETGYRYYSTRQFEVLNTIRYLRMLDLPLADIKEYMQNRKIPVIEEKLRHQKALIQQKKRELELIERKIDHRLQHIEDAKDSVLDQISLVSLPPLVWCASAIPCSRKRISTWNFRSAACRRYLIFCFRYPLFSFCSLLLIFYEHFV